MEKCIGPVLNITHRKGLLRSNCDSMFTIKALTTHTHTPRNTLCHTQSYVSEITWVCIIHIKAFECVLTEFRHILFVPFLNLTDLCFLEGWVFKFIFAPISCVCRCRGLDMEAIRWLNYSGFLLVLYKSVHFWTFSQQSFCLFYGILHQNAKPANPLCTSKHFLSTWLYVCHFVA